MRHEGRYGSALSGRPPLSAAKSRFSFLLDAFTTELEADKTRNFDRSAKLSSCSCSNCLTNVWSEFN